jgi:hypothetical protein
MAYSVKNFTSAYFFVFKISMYFSYFSTALQRAALQRINFFVFLLWTVFAFLDLDSEGGSTSVVVCVSEKVKT